MESFYSKVPHLKARYFLKKDSVASILLEILLSFQSTLSFQFCRAAMTGYFWFVLTIQRQQNGRTKVKTLAAFLRYVSDHFAGISRKGLKF